MANNENLNRFCTNAPDPREPGAVCDLRINRKTWRKIVHKHIANSREPWAEWFPPQLCQRLKAAWEPTAAPQERDTAIAEAEALLAKQIRQCLERPLAMLYEGCKQSEANVWQRWLLILRNGARVAVDATREPPKVVTCHFADAAIHTHRPRARWEAEVNQLVLTYCLLEKSSGGLQVKNLHTIQQDGYLETRSNIRFVAEEMWGVRRDENGRPHWGELPPWPENSQPGPSLQRVQLRSRSRQTQGETR